MLHNAISYHPLTIALAICPTQQAPLSLHIEHNFLWHGISLWIVQIGSPDHAPSQLLVHLLAARAWETEIALI